MRTIHDRLDGLARLEGGVTVEDQVSGGALGIPGEDQIDAPAGSGQSGHRCATRMGAALSPATAMPGVAPVAQSDRTI